MNRNLLQLVLRHADGLTADADADALLVRRFVATRDDVAFALLVKRHGPMVWAVCRQSVPNHADAEDAFQATFLALAQSAKKVRNPERLAGWLHAAAVRVAAKAKRSFTRRLKHERATAKAESDSPVSAAQWGELQAAVHAEVSGLPPSLRAVFVLCDLEGVEPAAAAKQLGLKPSTLTGQLARARQRLLAALTKRGLTAGAVALGTAVMVPEVLANKVAGGVVPSAAVVELATEVTAMGVHKLKLLAAGLLVAGGLTLSGLGLLSKADGQVPALPGGPSGPGGPGLPGPGVGPGVDPGVLNPGGPPGVAGPRGIGPEEGGLGGSADGGGPGVGGPGPVSGEFLYVAKPSKLTDVAKLLKDKSAKGWEYTGPLDVDPADPPKGKEFEDISKSTRVVLVFKKRPGLISASKGMGEPLNGFDGMLPSGFVPGATGGLPGLAIAPGFPTGPGSGGDVPGVPDGPTAGRPKTGGPTDGKNPGGAKAPGVGFAPKPGPIPGGSPPPTDTATDEQFTALKLKNANAEDAVKVLHEVFNGSNKGPGRVRLVAENRTNSIIVVKASAADMETMQTLLKTVLDTEAKAEKK